MLQIGILFQTLKIFHVHVGEGWGVLNPNSEGLLDDA